MGIVESNAKDAVPKYVKFTYFTQLTPQFLTYRTHKKGSRKNFRPDKGQAAC